MKLLTLLPLFWGLTSLSYGQDYRQFYLLHNQADSLRYHQQTGEAWQLIDNASELVPYVPSVRLRTLYTHAIEDHDFARAKRYGKTILIQSGEKSWIKSRSAAFRRTAYFSDLRDSTDFFLSLFDQRLNHQYIALIDSLYYVDQRVIRKNRSVKGDYQIDEASLPENRFDLDASNLQILYHWIQNVGFPSEERVGYEAYSQAAIILLHTLRLKENVPYHQEMIGYVMSGEYDRQDFSFWYEQYHTEVNGQSFFYLWDGDTSQENLDRIDHNRRRYYLKGVAAWTIRKGRKRFRPLLKW